MDADEEKKGENECSAAAAALGLPTQGVRAETKVRLERRSRRRAGKREGIWSMLPRARMVKMKTRSAKKRGSGETKCASFFSSSFFLLLSLSTSCPFCHLRYG